jgi:hypothetical protein
VPDKYNIKVNRPQPSEAEIDQHKNFNRVLAQYRRSKKSRSLHDSVSRLNKHIPVLVLMLVLAMLIVYFAKLMRKRPSPPPKAPITWVAPTVTHLAHGQLIIKAASWTGASPCG